jgi:hypothetical protein
MRLKTARLDELGPPQDRPMLPFIDDDKIDARVKRGGGIAGT